MYFVSPLSDFFDVGASDKCNTNLCVNISMGLKRRIDHFNYKQFKVPVMGNYMISEYFHEPGK